MRRGRSSRRLDVRPAKKLRNPGRHLRALARWPEWIADGLPTSAQVAGERYWNSKVPVFSKVVDPPHATDEARRSCLSAIFAAAASLEASPRTPRPCRVSCLVEWPTLFGSEATLFFEDDYFATFLPPAGFSRTEHQYGWVTAEPADPELIAAIRPPEPPGLTFHGGTRIEQLDTGWDEDGPGRQWTSYTWVWSFDRR